MSTLSAVTSRSGASYEGAAGCDGARNLLIVEFALRVQRYERRRRIDPEAVLDRALDGLELGAVHGLEAYAQRACAGDTSRAIC
jgi:hypothetical protein